MSETDVNYSGKRVVIGLTGRVDSAVAALLLKKQGMDVIGVSIVNTISDLYAKPEDAPKCHIMDLDQVKKVCDKINIPFYAADAKSEFDSEVIDPLISRKLVADANNSCFDCTRLRIKVLYDKMKKLKADYIATGHYCKVQKNLNSAQYFVHSNNDVNSDQSYLLSNVEDEHLKHLILPLGELKREEVLKIAKRFSIDAMDSLVEKSFCYRTPSSFENIVKDKVPKSLLKEGQIQNTVTELYHGDHSGVFNYYVGQKDIELKSATGTIEKDLEVVGYNFITGMIQVGPHTDLEHSGFQIVNLKLGKGLDRTRPMSCYLKAKYSEEYIKCNLFFKNNKSALIELDGPMYPIIHMESFVIYDRNTRNAKVIGAGSVGNIGDFELVDRVLGFRILQAEEDNEEEEVVSSSKLFKF